MDTLRMEISRDGVDVVSACPGPVHSGFLRQLLGADLNKVYTMLGCSLLFYCKSGYFQYKDI